MHVYCKNDAACQLRGGSCDLPRMVRHTQAASGHLSLTAGTVFFPATLLEPSARFWYSWGGASFSKA